MSISTAPRELVHFLLLDREAQAGAIRRMAALGWSEYGIAAATRLSVEQIRRILAPPAAVLADFSTGALSGGGSDDRGSGGVCGAAP